MIISKASLGVVELCRADKAIPVLGMVCIEGDGSVVASNGKVVAWVSPVTQRIRDAVPLPGKGLLKERVLLSAGTAQDLIKAMPRDTQFKGLLEHAAIEQLDAARVNVTVTDGRQKRVITVRVAARDYLQYGKVFTEAWANRVEGPEAGNVVMNRKRMQLAMQAIDKVCPYDGEFSPVYWTFTRQGNVIVRAENELTGQRLMAVFQSVDMGQSGQQLEMTVEEQRLVTPQRKAVRL